MVGVEARVMVRALPFKRWKVRAVGCLKKREDKRQIQKTKTKDKDKRQRQKTKKMLELNVQQSVQGKI
jgi:hypothetical protein